MGCRFFCVWEIPVCNSSLSVIRLWPSCFLVLCSQHLPFHSCVFSSVKCCEYCLMCFRLPLFNAYFILGGIFTVSYLAVFNLFHWNHQFVLYFCWRRLQVLPFKGFESSSVVLFVWLPHNLNPHRIGRVFQHDLRPYISREQHATSSLVILTNS